MIADPRIDPLSRSNLLQNSSSLHSVALDLTSRNVDGIGISVSGVDVIDGVENAGNNNVAGRLHEAGMAGSQRLNDAGLTGSDWEIAIPQQPEIIANWRRIILLIVAITVHNIPEGKCITYPKVSA